MRIGILTYTSSWGGTEVNTIGVARALVADGHAVTLVQLGHDEYSRHAAGEDHIELRQVELPAGLQSVPLSWWRGVVRELRSDVCVLSKGGFGVRASGLDVAARLESKRYVLLEHHPAELPPPRASKRHLGGLLPGLGLWWWRQYAPAWLHLRAAHRVVTDSDHVTDILVRAYGMPREKAFRVHPGIDPTAFSFRPRERDELRAQWGIPSNALVFGSVGRLAPVKALERALRGFADLASSPQARPMYIVIAGEGPERDALSQEARGLGIEANTIFPGRVADVAATLSAFDVFVMPSREEGFGIALVEAMACERVCVAMNSGGPGEILTDAALGWLTPADDQDAFNAALRDAAALSDEERRALGVRARQHVVANFDNATQMRRIAQLIVES